jgi:hypothetical protein
MIRQIISLGADCYNANVNVIYYPYSWFLGRILLLMCTIMMNDIESKRKRVREI